MATAEEVPAEKENFRIQQTREVGANPLCVENVMLQGGKLANRDDFRTFTTCDEHQIAADEGMTAVV